MSSGPDPQKIREGRRRGVGGPLRFLASLKLTLALLVILAAAVASAVFLQTTRNREWAQWYVYGRVWYLVLLVVLAVNIAATTCARFCRPTIRPALLIGPIGLLILLGGCIQTLVQGIEGRLILWPGQTADSVTLPDRSQISLLSPRGEQVETAELGFTPGPLDWPGHRSLDFGKANGVGIKLLRFYRHALYEPVWVANEAGSGEPAIQLAVSDSRGRSHETSGLCPSCSMVYRLMIKNCTSQSSKRRCSRCGTIFSSRRSPDGQPWHTFGPLQGSRLSDSGRWQYRQNDSGRRQPSDRRDRRVLSQRKISERQVQL